MTLFKKRPLSNSYTVVIDDAYLASNNSIVTPSELSMFVLTPYAKYQKDFYNNKARCFYERYSNELWFQWRYFMQAELLKKAQISENELQCETNEIPAAVKQFLESQEYKIFKPMYSQVPFLKKIAVQERMEEFKSKPADFHLGINLQSTNITHDLFPKIKKHIIIRNLEIKGMEAVCKFANICPDFLSLSFGIEKFKRNSVGHSVFDKNCFRLNAILTLQPEANTRETSEMLLSVDRSLNIQDQSTQSIFVNQDKLEFSEKDVESSLRILEMFCQEYGVLFDCPNKDFVFVVLFLRYVFCFCYLCSHQFDSHAEMSILCGDYHTFAFSENTPDFLIKKQQPSESSTNKQKEEIKNVNSFVDDQKTDSNKNIDKNMARKVFDHKNEILILKKSFECLKQNSADSDAFLKLFASQDGCFCCLADGCSKSFSDKDTAINHLKNKHQSVIEGLSSEVNKYNEFIDNIDPFFLFYAHNFEEKTIPKWLANAENSNLPRSQIIYNLIKPYSGDLK